MPRQGGAPAARQNPKPIVEVVRQFPHAEDIDARRRQLERQRNAVKPAANFQNCRHFGVIEDEAVRGRHSALVEQLDGGIP
jgi:hypothetical protein